jgi:REP element-mobilizing transposase RayT
MELREIVEWNGEEEHIHMRLRYLSAVVPSSVTGALKSESASAVLDRFGSAN